MDLKKLTDLPSIDIQKEIVGDIETSIEKTRVLIVNRFVSKKTIKPCYLPITDSGFEQPSGDDVKHVVSQIMAKGYSKGAVSRLVGVSDVKNRTILRWENEKSPIPYAAWRLLLSYAGLSIELELKEAR